MPLFSQTMINTKNYWKWKKRLCVRLCSRDRHHLRKSSDRKAQISSVNGTNAFLICAFDLQIFSGGVYPPSATSRTISFSISSSFWYWFDSFFRWEEGRCSRKFDRSFRCFEPLSRQLTVRILRRMRTVWKSGTFLATESVNSAPIKRGETRKVQIFGKEKCKTLRQY